MSIDVRTIIGEPKTTEDIFKAQKVKLEDSTQRLKALLTAREEIVEAVNTSNYANTEQSWHNAMSQLMGAFKFAIDEEKKNIVGA